MFHPNALMGCPVMNDMNSPTNPAITMKSRNLEKSRASHILVPAHRVTPSTTSEVNQIRESHPLPKTYSTKSVALNRVSATLAVLVFSAVGGTYKMSRSAARTKKATTALARTFRSVRHAIYALSKIPMIRGHTRTSDRKPHQRNSRLVGLIGLAIGILGIIFHYNRFVGISMIGFAVVLRFLALVSDDDNRLEL